MVVFSKVRLGVSPEINVLATLTITAVSVVIVAVNWFVARANRADAAI
jgi:putrescine transport system permease protein